MTHAKGAGIWALCSIILCGVLGLVWPKAWDTDIFHLMPESPLAYQAPTWVNNAINATTEHKVLLGVTGDANTVRAFVDTLEKDPAIRRLTGPVTEKDSPWAHLNESVASLSPATLESLFHHPDTVVSGTLSRLYQPMGLGSLKHLSEDPFLLTAQILMDKRDGAHFTVQNGLLTATDPESGTPWHVLTITLKPGTPASAWVDHLQDTIQTFKKEDAHFAVIKAGALFHGVAAQTSAKSDLTHLSVLSLIGLLLLTGFVFRGLRTFALALLSIGIGAMCGLVASLLLWGTLPLLTLVMCMSLVGVASDYTTYFMVRRLDFGDTESPLASIQKLRPVMTHALLTTLLAYGMLYLSPFIVLKQLAVFAVCGMTGAALTVWLFFPYLVPHGGLSPKKPSYKTMTALGTTLSSLWVKVPRRLALWVLVTMLGVWTVGGLAQLNPVDDLGFWRQANPTLDRDEAIWTRLFNKPMTQSGLVLVAPNASTLFDTLDHLQPDLQALPLLVPSFVSVPTQTKAITALENLYPLLQAKVPSLTWPALPYRVTSWEDWTTTPFGTPFADLLLHDDHQVALFMPWTSSQPITENSVIASLLATQSSLSLIAPRQAWEAALTHTQSELLRLMAFSGIGVLGLLVLSLGWRHGLEGAGVLLFSIGSSLALLGWLHQPLTIFAGFATILTVGIGVDYVFYRYQKRVGEKENTSTQKAMTLAWLTTLMSLGILAWSQTPVIHQFGLVLSLSMTMMVLGLRLLPGVRA